MKSANLLIGVQNDVLKIDSKPRSFSNRTVLLSEEMR